MYYKTIRALPSSAAHHPPLTTIHRPTRYLDTPPHELPSTSCAGRGRMSASPMRSWMNAPSCDGRPTPPRMTGWCGSATSDGTTAAAVSTRLWTPLILARQERYGSDPVNDDG